MAKTEKNTPSVKLGVPVGGGGHVLLMPYSENACYLQQVKYIKDVVHIYYTHFWQGETVYDLKQMY